MARTSILMTALAGGAFTISVTATPLLGQRQNANQPVQNRNQGQANNQVNNQTKAQRVEDLKKVVASDDQVIQLLESEEPPAKSKTQRNTLIDSVTKSRNATMRYVNDLEGRDPETGIQSEQKSAHTAAKKVQPAQDRYTALVQAHQLLEQNYNVLSQEPRGNNHHDNALKFMQQARTPLQQEVDAYAAAHPEVNVAQAQQAAQAAQAQQASQAQQAAAAIPGQPAENNVALSSPQRIQDLQNVIPHLEHSIDMTNAEADDGQKHRQKTLDALVRARDTVRQMLDQSQGRAAADLSKDVQNDHSRDAAKQNINNQSGYAALQRIQQYLHNDRVIIARQADDPQHLRASALDAIDQAAAAVQQQMEDYNRAHPNEKH